MSGFRRRSTAHRGVTLIELLLALVLFAIGATALAGGMRSAIRSSAIGRAWTSGAFAAESRLEQLRARCAASGGTARSGSVAESWVVGPATGTMLPSVHVEDSITMTMTAGISRRAVQSVVRCVP